MKKMLSPFLLILSIFVGQFGSINLSLADDSHVGDIRYSILSEVDFRKLHGNDWEILRGQAVPNDSALREYWRNGNLPDARGVFLRSANHGRAHNEGNPEGTLPIGEYRRDEIVMHNHPHSHTWESEHSGFAAGGHTAHMQRTRYGNSGAVRTSTDTTCAGGAETRPRNITVNTFVKVRESAPANHQTQITAEWVAQLFQSAEFLRALREAVIAAFRDFI